MLRRSTVSSDVIRRVLGGLGLVCLVAFGQPGAGRAADLDLVTEEYPPFNMTYQGRITGTATERVEAMFKKAGLTYTLQLLPWARAYDLAQTRPGTCVFSTTETPERKALFQWVGPLVHDDWVILARADETRAIHAIDDLRPFRVGGYIGDAVGLYLESQGLQVDKAPTDALNAQKLVNGRIDFWATGSQSGPFLAEQQGITGLKPVLTFKETVMSLACHPETDPALVARLQEALDSLDPPQ